MEAATAASYVGSGKQTYGVRVEWQVLLHAEPSHRPDFLNENDDDNSKPKA